MPIRRKKQDVSVNFRITAGFKEKMEQAAETAGLPSVSEFIKQAVIEKSERHGVRFDRFV